jgi:tetratricopeptide (TPR) repeat protein
MSPAQEAFPSSVAQCEQLLSVNPAAALFAHERSGELAKAVQTWVDCGDFEQSEQHRDEAVACYKKALGLDPQAVSVRLRLCDLYSSLGKKPEAVAELVWLADFYFPNDRRNLAFVLERLGKLDPGAATAWELKHRRQS